MTWHHVALVLLAVLLVVGVIVVCAGKPDCNTNVTQAIQVSLVIISATLGNATQLRQPKNAQVAKWYESGNPPNDRKDT